MNLWRFLTKGLLGIVALIEEWSQTTPIVPIDVSSADAIRDAVDRLLRVLYPR